MCKVPGFRNRPSQISPGPASLQHERFSMCLNAGPPSSQPQSTFTTPTTPATSGTKRQMLAWLQVLDPKTSFITRIDPAESGTASQMVARLQVLDPQGFQAASQKRPAQQSEPQQAKEAHVVAPCPHDGGCPMEGTKSWCHFAQRFQRSHLQRQHKVGCILLYTLMAACY